MSLAKKCWMEIVSSVCFLCEREAEKDLNRSVVDPAPH